MDIYVYINGVRKSLMQLSQESGVEYETIYARWKNGVPADQLVELPEPEEPEEPLTKGEVVEALGYAPGMVNPNLLDNWYFVNPVNQRGKTSYTTTGYTIDRWVLRGSGSVKVNNGTVTIRRDGSGSGSWHTFTQAVDRKLSAIKGKTVCFSALVESADGEFRLAFTDNTLTTKSSFTVPAGTSGLVYHTWKVIEDLTGNLVVSFFTPTADVDIKISSAKLEIGDTQTLAHQDASGNWVLNEIPNYAEQLAICTQYNHNTGAYRGVCAIDLLWTNASPGSDFAAQTISVTLSGYDLIFVTGISQPGTSNGMHFASSFVPNAVGNAGVIFEMYTDYWEMSRNFQITSGGIKFSSGYMADHAGHGYYNAWNSRAIPIAVYGIKGVT